MAQGKLIKQHNAITAAHYDMSAMQKNLFYMLLAQLKEDMPTLTVYEINIKEIEQIRGVTIRSDEIFTAANKLTACTITLYDQLQGQFFTIEPITSARYEKGKRKLQLEIDRKIIPFLFNLKNNYTTYQLKNAVILNSKYSKRIYEMLAQFKDTGWFVVTIRELKERLELINQQTGQEKFSRYALFKKRVLEIAQQELKNHTDLYFTYKAEKNDRKYTKLLFKIIPNLQPGRSNKLSTKRSNYPNPGLNEDVLSQYKLISGELNWLNKKQAYTLVTNVPTQQLWQHIDKLKLLIQSGRGANPAVYFEDVLKRQRQKARVNSKEAKAVASMKEQNQRKELDEEALLL